MQIGHVFFSGLYSLGCRGQAKATRNREAERSTNKNHDLVGVVSNMFYLHPANGGNDPSSRAYLFKRG